MIDNTFSVKYSTFSQIINRDEIKVPIKIGFSYFLYIYDVKGPDQNPNCKTNTFTLWNSKLLDSVFNDNSCITRRQPNSLAQ